MRKKNPEIMEHIIRFTDEYQRLYGRSPSTTEIANEVGVARGTAYTYLTAMHDQGLINYDGKCITTAQTAKVNHSSRSIPLVGHVVCGDMTEEMEAVEEYIDLPTSIFGSGELFILQAYGDSMDLAGINAGDYLVVKKQSTARNGDLVIALSENGENNCKRFHTTDHGTVILSPESSNPYYQPKEYTQLVIQGVVTQLIRNM